MATEVQSKVVIDEEEFSRDGNALWLMGCFQEHARRQGWTKDQIDAALDEALASAYDNLLATLMANIELV